ncbi:ABC transporter permease [Butyrivibrio sp. DSM 10294]|uniref:ABC transporter permease n=1 Tax=Butyrivibrio sp. DSM 10294 TaxID=2972457 RepID=UPI00234F8DC1|nr:ABC transporter permease [Butyrivibrio sp. DSM 10294]MDC7292695.1 ABC transporter permease [Butyrivibrio sp. DSM 10294]
MVRFEIKKIFSRAGGKLALLLLFIILVIVSVFAVRYVDYTDENGNNTYGFQAVRLLRERKSEWSGYLTEDVFAAVIKENAAIEATPEAKSKDFHENNKAYAKKQGFSDIRDIINSSLSSFREYNYYLIDGANVDDSKYVYQRRISTLQEWLNSDEAKDRYSASQKEFFLEKYQELDTPLYYEDADGWKALLEYSQTIIMLTMLILSFLVCGIFSGEYQLNADAVFFSTAEGRRKGIRAKILAGLVMITIVYWGMVIIYSLVVLGILGTSGWNCPIQTSLYGWKSLYNITFFEDYLFTIIGGYIGNLAILFAEMLLSVITRSAVISITFPFVILFLPSFVGGIDRLSEFLGLFPDQLLQIGVAVRLFNTYEIGSKVFGALPILFISYPIIVCLMIPIIYQIYRKSEIR